MAARLLVEAPPSATYAGWLAVAAILSALGTVLSGIVGIVVQYMRRHDSDVDDTLLQLLLEERARRLAAEPPAAPGTPPEPDPAQPGQPGAS